MSNLEILYEFQMSHNAAEATKNIGFVKVQGAIDHSKVFR